MYVVVTGPPAPGTSALARALAAELGLPLLARDTFKAGLVEALGAGSVEESRRLEGAAVRTLLAVAAENGSGVLDSVWVDRSGAVAELAALPAQVVEVVCRPADELGNQPSLTSLGGPWPVVEVDTSRTADVFAVVERVLVDAGAADQGMDPPPRPLEPVDPTVDLQVLGNFARRWTTTLLDSGHVPEPFAVVLTLTGTPELVAPATWLAGPANWTMVWGEPDELDWARGALERTDVRHRAHAIVRVDQEAGTIRVVAEHRADGSTRDDALPIGVG